MSKNKRGNLLLETTQKIIHGTTIILDTLRNLYVRYGNFEKIGISISTDPEADLHVKSETKDDVVVKIEGTQGELFSVIDNLDTILQSVNDISGMPVLEVYADDRVVVYGTFQHSLKPVPSTPSANNSYTYLTATGTTPNREVAAKIKFEDGSEFIIASVIV